MAKIHRHKFDHRGCIGEECVICFEANIKCTFDNVWCSQNPGFWINIWGYIITLVMFVGFVIWQYIDK